MKKYFQSLYDETGKKPFTPLNFFLMIGIPAIIMVIALCMSGSQSDSLFTVAVIAAVVGWIINLALCIKNFGNRGVGLFFLTLLASIAFFCSFILWPFLKWSVRAGAAVFHANLGNTTASMNASSRAGATKGKRSALNWFSYDGTVYHDEKEVMPDDIGGSGNNWTEQFSQTKGTYYTDGQGNFKDQYGNDVYNPQGVSDYDKL